MTIIISDEEQQEEGPTEGKDEKQPVQSRPKQPRKCWETGPSGWEPTNREKETEPDGSGRNPTESDENRKQGHICKYISMCLLRLYL